MQLCHKNVICRIIYDFVKTSTSVIQITKLQLCYENVNKGKKGTLSWLCNEPSELQSYNFVKEMSNMQEKIKGIFQ